MKAPEFLVIGKLRRPHGVKGELIMDVMTDFPERIKPGLLVYAGESRQPMHLRRCRGYENALLVSFDGIATSEAAGEWRNALVSVRTDEIPALPEGEYYQHQLVGLRVVSDEGEQLGQVTGFLETGANDICIVHPETGPDILIPVVDEFILQVDLEGGVVRVHLIEGMR